METKACFGTPLDNMAYRKRIAVYAVIFNGENNQVATIQNSKGYRFLPGGGIESGENHSECLTREVIEELGYEVEMGDYIGVAEQYCMSTTNEPILNIGHFYVCTLLNRVQSSTKPEHQICWTDALHIEEDMFLQHQGWAVKEALKMSAGH